MKRYFLLILILTMVQFCGSCQRQTKTTDIIVGAARFSEYLPSTEGQRIAIVANPTSRVGDVHLVDTLHALDVDIRTIFCPEHGFRGEAEAGAGIGNGKDLKTGIPIISLYGKQKKPSREMLKDIDVVIFDIQDVGARFYTYISTMSYVLDACAEYGIAFIILDRPNPNGHYVDGPVLEKQYSSFVGLHPVPVVHGMTVGEYARMVVGEGWLESTKKPDLKVITCLNYTHATHYDLPVKPSPNLPDMNSIYLYPSLCFFEGTAVSVGRGTEKPFSQYGHPDFAETGYTFTPVSIPGASKYPKHKNTVCNGYLLTDDAADIKEDGRIHLSYLINAYKQIGNEEFFNSFFEKLAGTDELRKQIQSGMSETEISESWRGELTKFKTIRNKYLLYK